MTNDKNISGRTHGSWALFLAVCGLAGVYREPMIFIFCNLASLSVWSYGCEMKRGKKYWPASFVGKRYLIHIALMYCVAGITVGGALGMYNFINGAAIGISAILFVLSWDLIKYDTVGRYNEITAQREKQAKLDDQRSNRSILLKLPSTQKVIAAATVLTLIVVVVAEFKNIVSQLSEWWILFFDK